MPSSASDAEVPDEGGRVIDRDVENPQAQRGGGAASVDIGRRVQVELHVGVAHRKDRSCRCRIDLQPRTAEVHTASDPGAGNCTVRNRSASAHAPPAAGSVRMFCADDGHSRGNRDGAPTAESMGIPAWMWTESMHPR